MGYLIRPGPRRVWVHNIAADDEETGGKPCLNRNRSEVLAGYEEILRPFRVGEIFGDMVIDRDVPPTQVRLRSPG